MTRTKLQDLIWTRLGYPLHVRTTARLYPVGDVYQGGVMMMRDDIHNRADNIIRPRSQCWSRLHPRLWGKLWGRLWPRLGDLIGGCK